MGRSEIAKRLAEPFRNVSFRIGSRNRDKTKGMVLTYIDARDLMDRLDDVVGSENWTTEFKEVAGRVVCRLGIRLYPGEPFVYKEDGAGETDMEGEKGALSDAFKRVGVHFGCGRYLYREPTTWVNLTNDGKWLADGEEERVMKEYLRRHFGGDPPPQQRELPQPDRMPNPPGFDDVPPTNQQARRAAEPLEPMNLKPVRDQVGADDCMVEPQVRDMAKELAEAQAVVAERKKVAAKQFALAEKLWGKPIPSERRFQIMDWVLGKMGLRVQKQLDTLEKCGEAMRWIDQYEASGNADRNPRF